MANAAMGWDKACFEIDFDFFESPKDCRFCYTWIKRSMTKGGTPGAQSSYKNWKVCTSVEAQESADMCDLPQLTEV